MTARQRRRAAPLPFDDDLQAAPAYWGVVDPTKLAARPADVLPPRIAGHDDVRVVATDRRGANVAFALPEAGATVAFDNVMVPVGSPHKANAEALFDYYYDPQVAAEVAAYVNYICPVEGAKQAMEKIDPSLVDNLLIFPDEEFLSNAYGFMEVDEKTRQQYDKDFAKVIGA